MCTNYHHKTWVLIMLEHIPMWELLLLRCVSPAHQSASPDEIDIYITTTRDRSHAS